jgi:hypothetical protein
MDAKLPPRNPMKTPGNTPANATKSVVHILGFRAVSVSA